jgi:hypothetical protein
MEENAHEGIAMELIYQFLYGPRGTTTSAPALFGDTPLTVDTTVEAPHLLDRLQNAVSRLETLPCTHTDASAAAESGAFWRAFLRSALRSSDLKAVCVLGRPSSALAASSAAAERARVIAQAQQLGAAGLAAAEAAVVAAAAAAAVQCPDEVLTQLPVPDASRVPRVSSYHVHVISASFTLLLVLLVVTRELSSEECGSVVEVAQRSMLYCVLLPVVYIASALTAAAAEAACRRLAVTGRASTQLYSYDTLISHWQSVTLICYRCAVLLTMLTGASSNSEVCSRSALPCSSCPVHWRHNHYSYHYHCCYTYS